MWTWFRRMNLVAKQNLREKVFGKQTVWAKTILNYHCNSFNSFRVNQYTLMTKHSIGKYCMLSVEKIVKCLEWFEENVACLMDYCELSRGWTSIWKNLLVYLLLRAWLSEVTTIWTRANIGITISKTWLCQASFILDLRSQNFIE